MLPFILDAIQPAVLPATVLLAAVLLYWLLVIVGAASVDVFDIDLGGDGPGGDDIPAGIWPGVLQFFHLRDVPLTIVGSLFALFLWTSVMLASQLWNPQHDPGRGFVLLGAAGALSLVLTRLATTPLVPLFRSLNREDIERLQPGQRARVTSSAVTDSYGEITIERSGPPTVLNARCRGAHLVRGEWVELVAFDPETNTWLVQLPKKPERPRS